MIRDFLRLLLILSRTQRWLSCVLTFMIVLTPCLTSYHRTVKRVFRTVFRRGLVHLVRPEQLSTITNRVPFDIRERSHAMSVRIAVVESKRGVPQPARKRMHAGADEGPGILSSPVILANVPVPPGFDGGIPRQDNPSL